jgi:hypothetical protein
MAPKDKENTREYRANYEAGRHDSNKEGIVSKALHPLRELMSSDSPRTDAYEDGYHGRDFDPPSSGGDGGSSGGCFLTTACAQAMGLPDDCTELQTLRAFRDNHVLHSPGGRALVKEYYAIAPGIVSSLEARADARSLFHDLYVGDIRAALSLIERGKDDEAMRHYQRMTRRLETLCKTSS